MDKAAELPPPETFVESVENAINMIDQVIDPNTSSRLRMFLGKCQKLGLRAKKAKTWLPFRTYAMQTRPHWPEPKPYRLTVFNIINDRNNPALWFPVNQYYTTVQGVDTESIKRTLYKLGFVPSGKLRDYRLNLRDKNYQAFFDELFSLVIKIEEAFAATL